LRSHRRTCRRDAKLVGQFDRRSARPPANATRTGGSTGLGHLALCRSGEKLGPIVWETTEWTAPSSVEAQSLRKSRGGPLREEIRSLARLVGGGDIATSEPAR